MKKLQEKDNNLESTVDPKVQKLIDYAKDKQIVSWDEINEILGQDFVNSPKMEPVLQLLTQNNIQVMEEDDGLDEDEADDEDLETDEDAELADEEQKDDNAGHSDPRSTGLY